MLRRVSWFAAGAAAGMGGAVYAQRKAKAVVRQITPPVVARKALDGVKDRVTDAGEALRAGREAMQRTERRLKAERDGVPLLDAELVDGGRVIEANVDGRPVRLVVLPGTGDPIPSTVGSGSSRRLRGRHR
jgi:hypothetical protein